MKWFRRLLARFGRPAPSPQPTREPEHAVIITIALEGLEWPSQDGLERLFALEDTLRDAVDAQRAGEVDGHSVGPDRFDIYCYGPNADRLWDAVAPALEKQPFPRGSHAIKRFGPADAPDAREERIDLHWDG